MKAKLSVLESGLYGRQTDLLLVFLFLLFLASSSCRSFLADSEVCRLWVLEARRKANQEKIKAEEWSQQ
jgi:hypothetical protein